MGHYSSFFAMNTKASYAAIGLMIASIALSIACMSTLAWVVDESGTTTLSIGLKKYKQESPRETLTGTLKELQVRYPLARKLADGGDSVLACGIVSDGAHSHLDHHGCDPCH